MIDNLRYYYKISRLFPASMNTGRRPMEIE